MARVADLSIDQGSRWQAVISAPVEWLTDLTGYSARGKVKTSRTLPNAEVLFDFQPYMTVVSAENLVLIDLPADISAAMDWEHGEYNMELDDGNPAHEVRFLQGKIRIGR